MRNKEKPKLGVPQLWYDSGYNILRLIDPTGRVEAMDLDQFTKNEWFQSLFSSSSQEVSQYRIEPDHEFICNIE